MLGCVKNGFRTRVFSIVNYETGSWSRFGGISVPFLLTSICLGKRPDTVGEPLATFPSRCCYIEFSKLLWVWRGCAPREISGSLEFANSIRAFVKDQCQKCQNPVLGVSSSNWRGLIPKPVAEPSIV